MICPKCGRPVDIGYHKCKRVSYAQISATTPEMQAHLDAVEKELDVKTKKRLYMKDYMRKRRAR